jgi:hypothetical protein
MVTVQLAALVALLALLAPPTVPPAAAAAVTVQDLDGRSWNPLAPAPGDALPAIQDSGLVLADAAGATIEPQAVVYTSKGLMYRGRINDLYVDIGRKRRAPTPHDLRDAIDTARAGRAAALVSTQAVGCFIERPRR